MDTFYLIFRIGAVLAVVAGLGVGVGMCVGWYLWRDRQVEENSSAIESENRKLKEELGSLKERQIGNPEEGA